MGIGEIQEKPIKAPPYQNGITQPVPTVHTIHKVLDINSRQHLWRHEAPKLSDTYGIQHEA